MAQLHSIKSKRRCSNHALHTLAAIKCSKGKSLRRLRLHLTIGRNFVLDCDTGLAVLTLCLSHSCPGGHRLLALWPRLGLTGRCCLFSLASSGISTLLCFSLSCIPTSCGSQAKQATADRPFPAHLVLTFSICRVACRPLAVYLVLSLGPCTLCVTDCSWTRAGGGSNSSRASCISPDLHCIGLSLGWHPAPSGCSALLLHRHAEAAAVNRTASAAA